MFDRLKEWFNYEVYEDDNYYDKRTIQKIENMRRLEELEYPYYNLSEEDKARCYDIVEWVMDFSEPEAAAAMYVLTQKYPKLALEGVAEGMKR